MMFGFQIPISFYIYLSFGILVACQSDQSTVSFKGSIQIDPFLCLSKDTEQACVSTLVHHQPCLAIQLLDQNTFFLLKGFWQNDQQLDIPDLNQIRFNVGQGFSVALYLLSGEPNEQLCDLQSPSEITKAMQRFETCDSKNQDWCKFRLFKDENVYQSDQNQIDFRDDLKICVIESTIDACQSLNCLNGIQDQDESSVDCGGSICGVCEDQQKCLENRDCLDICNQNHRCCQDMDDDLICDEVDLCPQTPSSQFEIKNNQKLVIEQDQESYFLELGFPNQGNRQLGIGCSDFDQDGILDLLDNCPTLVNPAQENQFGGKFLGDHCEDQDQDFMMDFQDTCVWVENIDQIDTDQDGLGNACDEDQDQDSVANEDDLNPLDPMICLDSDSDLCDDCAQLGMPTPNMDGMDLDGDGLCDIGDLDIDQDMVLNVEDLDFLNRGVCADRDADGCDDCASQSFNPNADGEDLDMDGLCNIGDPDDDNDGVLDLNELPEGASCDPPLFDVNCASNFCLCVYACQCMPPIMFP
jgi:hypothetical protein